MNSPKYQVLLYYKYVKIKNPEEVLVWQRELCESLNLQGRIIVATEGINGTVEGKTQNTKKYISAMEDSDLFKKINFKKSEGSGDAFGKLIVRVRPEVVTARIPIDPTKASGKYITAEKLHQWFDEKKEFYIVDMRNDYEYQSGHFKNFIPSGIHNFYDLPDVLPKLEHLKNKTIVTVCTGGIRCEKASGFLLMNGFNDVYQLEGGIQTYMEKYPNQNFLGKLYVFDKRLTIGFNIDDPQHKIVGKCMNCNKASDSYVNCEYDICHHHHIRCDECLDQEFLRPGSGRVGLAFCKKECKEKYLNGPQFLKAQKLDKHQHML